MLEQSQSGRTSFRQAGRASSGKLLKGANPATLIKTSAASIPSKFETIIFLKNPKKAFGSTSNRFFQQNLANDELPGPGHYHAEAEANASSALSFYRPNAQSYSVKGYGNGFLSKTERRPFDVKYINSGPGPGQYRSARSLGGEETNITEASSTFEANTLKNKNKPSYVFQAQGREDLETNSLKTKILPPGPGEYEPSFKPKNENPFSSAFVSKTNRGQYLKFIPKTPAPGQYEIIRDIKNEKPYTHSGSSSSFAQPIEVKKKTGEVQELIKFLDDPSEKKGIKFKDYKSDKFVPGPGYYQNIDKYSLAVGKQIGPNSVFMPSRIDRFGESQPIASKLTIPGPGSYSSPPGISRSASEKALVTGSVFMSETTRKPFGEEIGYKKGPGENITYLMPKKKSFHLNLARKWL